MSKNKRKRNNRSEPGDLLPSCQRRGGSEADGVVGVATGLSQPAEPPAGGVRRVFNYFRQRLWLVGVIALVSLGAVGAVWKNLEERGSKERWPQAGVVLPSPTPQLSKEYIYAGSRLLAVEDANANAAPPADLAVWRPTTGYWYVLGGPGSQQTFFQWGTSGDIPVPGDFDGDGKTDFSIYRPGSSATWWVSFSSTGSYTSVQFGTTGDLHAPADFDGDGKTDLAVFRPSTGYWYIYQSSTQSTVTPQFGSSGDVPAPADYDGDGKADLAVWRNSNTTFYSVNSGNQASAGAVFTSTGTQVSGDYDGDGRADYAILNGNSWIIKSSVSGSTTATTWQNSGDTPVQNDYDADGKVDIAVWRDSNGYWYIKQSTDGQTRSVQWGMSGDIPVPAFYRR